jgi:hypothetical protein
MAPRRVPWPTHKLRDKPKPPRLVKVADDDDATTLIDETPVRSFVHRG